MAYVWVCKLIETQCVYVEHKETSYHRFFLPFFFWFVDAVANAKGTQNAAKKDERVWDVQNAAARLVKLHCQKNVCALAPNTLRERSIDDYSSLALLVVCKQNTRKTNAHHNFCFVVAMKIFLANQLSLIRFFFYSLNKGWWKRRIKSIQRLTHQVIQSFHMSLFVGKKMSNEKKGNEKIVHRL